LTHIAKYCKAYCKPSTSENNAVLTIYGKLKACDRRILFHGHRSTHKSSHVAAVCAKPSEVDRVQQV